MAFKRNNFKTFTEGKAKYFKDSFKFNKVTKFEEGKDVYFIPLGMETGFYEAPYHTVKVHKVKGQIVGFKNSIYDSCLKCTGVSEDGSKNSSLCCDLAQREYQRLPEDPSKRIISFTKFKTYLPVMILGNDMNDDSKLAFPIQKVSILNELKKGLKFAYIEMASSSFKDKILNGYGKKLKEDEIIDYDMDENSEEFYEEVRKRLPKTIIKATGTKKDGFNAPIKEYSFFPFKNTIASKSKEGEREAILNYRKNEEIMARINEFLTLFDVEVDNLLVSWTDKELNEYYRSAIGEDLGESSKEEESKEEKVEFVEPTKATPKKEVSSKDTEDISEEELDDLIADTFSPKKEENSSKEEASSLDDFEYDTDEDGDFFGESEDYED